MNRHLRIAQVAPPLEPVPPRGYGGTERIVHALTTELVDRGHALTTFASGDSETAGTLVPTVERALRPAGIGGDWAPWVYSTIRQVLDRAHDFDVIHAHLEWANPLLAAASPVPVLSTFHGRLDLPWATELLSGLPGAIAISRSQAASHPAVRWAGIVHNGLPLHGAPFSTERDDALVFVGRVAPEKGIVEAIEVARLTGRPLRIVAKRPVLQAEIEYFDAAFAPALRSAGSLVEDLGELDGAERDAIVARSHALLMPGRWPEPFGLAAIEALACGTPVLTHRVGALPEIIRDGVDGFFGDDVEHLAFLAGRVGELDRAAIRASVLERFSATRMATRYEALYMAAAGDAMTADQSSLVAVGPGLSAADELRDRFGEQLTHESALVLDAAEGPPMRSAGRRAAEAEADRLGSRR
jgi:glycosyltransferase involved in cell wall biosynthesis